MNWLARGPLLTSPHSMKTVAATDLVNFGQLDVAPRTTLLPRSGGRTLTGRSNGSIGLQRSIRPNRRVF